MVQYSSLRAAGSNPKGDYVPLDMSFLVPALGNRAQGRDCQVTLSSRSLKKSSAVT